MSKANDNCCILGENSAGIAGSFISVLVIIVSVFIYSSAGTDVHCNIKLLYFSFCLAQ